jgi:hypothetical protein
MLSQEESDRLDAAILAGVDRDELAREHGLCKQAISNRRRRLGMPDLRRGSRAPRHVEGLLAAARANPNVARSIEVAAQIVEAQRVAGGDGRYACACGEFYDEEQAGKHELCLRRALCPAPR